MAYTTADIIAIAKASQFLAHVDIKKGGLYGQRPSVFAAKLLYLERMSLEKRYAILPNVSAVAAVGSISVTDIGRIGDTISLYINLLVGGRILIGTYIRAIADTTATILATNFKNALSLNGFIFTSNTNIITVTAPASLGANVNNSLELVIVNIRLFNSTFDNTFN